MSFVSSNYVWVIIALSVVIGIFLIFTIIRFCNSCCLRKALFPERNLGKSQSEEATVDEVSSDCDDIELGKICDLPAREVMKAELSLNIDRCIPTSSCLRQADGVEGKGVDKRLSSGKGGKVMNEVKRLEEINRLSGQFSVKKSVSFSDDKGWNAFGSWKDYIGNIVVSPASIKSKFRTKNSSDEEQKDAWTEEGEKERGEDINKDGETFFGLANYWNSPLTRSTTEDSAEDSGPEANFRDVCGDIYEDDIVQGGLDGDLKKKLEELLERVEDEVDAAQQYRSD